MATEMMTTPETEKAAVAQYKAVKVPAPEAETATPTAEVPEPAPQAEPMPASTKAPSALREVGVVGMRGAPRPRRVVALADVEAAVAACRSVGAADASPCLAAELTRRGYQVEVGPMEPLELAEALEAGTLAAEEGALE